ncbi:MAG: hypothetical protein J1F31_06535 [Erysipelotrichales bacterium]|nr:hypothetical protein [Erysipelotrichales bacterium]
MKKKFILFAALLMILTSCGKGKNSGSVSTPSVNTSDKVDDEPSASIPPVENTIYFNLGKYGLFDGKAGTDISSASLEYGVSYTALTGTALPGADRVTSSRGVKFLYWVMPSTTGGALIKVEKMPANPGTILEAWWEEGNVNNPDIPDIPDIPDDPIGDYKQYLATSADSDKKYGLTSSFSATFNTNEYSVTADFAAGYEFKFYSTTDLFGYGSKCYPTSKSDKKTESGYSLCADASAGIYAKDYIEVTGTPKEGGVNPYGEDWMSFAGDAPNLRFKESGNYTLYIRLYDGGGWLQIYAVKNS